MSLSLVIHNLEAFEKYVDDLKNNYKGEYKGEKIISYGQAWDEDLDKSKDITFLKIDSDNKLSKKNIQLISKEQLQNINEFSNEVSKIFSEANGNHKLFFEKYQNKYNEQIDTLTKESFMSSYNVIIDDIANKDFLPLIWRQKNSVSLIFRRALNDENFMKEVVKIHGTDAKIIENAVDVITDIKDESPKFKAKLFNDTLKTDEYKQAFDKEQGKTIENTR